MQRIRLTASSLLVAIALLGQPAWTMRAAPTQGPDQPIETGKFRLHKFEQPIGEETYQVSRDGDSLVVKTDFAFTDRGSRVPLTATLRTRQDLTPVSYEIKGKTSRISDIDTSVSVDGRSATIREGKQSRQAAVPDRFFAISGYAPVTIQMMMLRYWTSHGAGPLKMLPGGEAAIEDRGPDSVQIDGKQVQLERYSVSGVIWGREALWLDASKQLVAAVTDDAEFDHFEAIREGYEAALPVFIAKAAEDGMASLAQLAAKMSPSGKGGTFAIVGATLVDATGGPAINDSTVVVQGGRITAAGPRAQVKIPRGCTVIDAHGKTLLPGLWDMHAHFEQVEWGPIYLAAGVTTVRDVGNEFEFIVSVRKALRSDRGLGPRLLAAGIVDGDGPAALGIVRANTPEQARTVVGRYKEAGFEQIKIYSSVKPEIVKAVCDEAHRLGMTVTGHIPQGMNAFQGVEAGMDQINHVQYLPPVMRSKSDKPTPGGAPSIDLGSDEAKKAIAFFKEHGTVLDPTLVIFEMLTHPIDTPVASFEPGIAKVAPELAGPLNNTGVPAIAAPRGRAIFEQYLAIVGALHRAGIPIVAGTDQTVPGHSVHREIELYVKAGFTPLEAIQAATIVPARVMKLDKEVGTIEVGKKADFIILDGNPLDNISNIRRVKTVVHDGRVYDCAALWKSVGFQP
jgi:imidazolonepropionase-like amidohydrolase